MAFSFYVWAGRLYRLLGRKRWVRLKTIRQEMERRDSILNVQEGVRGVLHAKTSKALGRNP